RLRAFFLLLYFLYQFARLRPSSHNYLEDDEMNLENQLAKANAFHQKSHFVYTSTDHGEAYVNLRILAEPENEGLLRQTSLRLIEQAVKVGEINHKYPV